MSVSVPIKSLLDQVAKGRHELTGAELRRVTAALCAHLRGRFAGSGLSHEDFEEAAADACFDFLRAKEPIRDSLAWLRNTAKARAIDRVRKLQVRPVEVISYEAILGAPSTEPTIEERFEQRAQLAHLRALMAKLPRRFQAALVASDQIQERNLTVAEACKRLGVPRSTFHDQVKRASRRLQKEFSAAP